MSGGLIGERFGAPSASTEFDPKHFLGWWEQRNGPPKVVDAINEYREDTAGNQAIVASTEDCIELWENWCNADLERIGSATAPSIIHSTDTITLHRVLRDRVFSRNLNEPARILVAGDVQSGKTGSYTQLIDLLMVTRGTAGFPERYIFVVLAGVHNKLREQTQKRLEQDLLRHTKAGDIVWLTSSSKDIGSAASRVISQSESTCYVAVVKKVKSTLETATGVLQKSPDASPFGVVILDDECDQITPDEKSQPKANSSRISELVWGNKRPEGSTKWGMLNKYPNGVVYMGYTATPYSNVFLDGERERSMYPITYMHVLTPGEGYMGYDHYWPDKENPPGSVDVFMVSRGEINNRKNGPNPFEVSGTKLESAVLWFIIASAIKRARLKDGQINHKDRHTSMLVNTHVQVDKHVHMRAAVSAYVSEFKNLWKNDQATAIQRLDQIWAQARGSTQQQTTRYMGDPDDLHCIWGKWVGVVLENITVVCDNSRSNDRLEYPNDEDPILGSDASITEVIAVGGYTLSRGITLRGLVSSYMSRITKVVYDTYLQLSRWFGYREGYKDLTRLWVSEEVSESYREIAAADRKFKEALRLAGMDPNGPFGHEQIYLGAIAGAKPSNRLDSIIRSNVFGPGTPHGPNFFGPSPSWSNSAIEKFINSSRTGQDVVDLLQSYAGSQVDRVRALADFITETKDLLKTVWDLNTPIPAKSDDQQFERGKKTPPVLVAQTNDWFIKTPTDPTWRILKNAPLVIIAPVEVHPPAEASAAAPRKDWAMALMFDKRYGPAETYRNEWASLRAREEEVDAGESVGEVSQ